MGVNRRKFLSASTVLTGLFGVNSVRSFFNVSNDVHYLAISGNFSSEKTIGVGLLSSSLKNKTFSDLCTEKRIKYNYRGQLKYKSSDKYKVALCKDLIDYFIDSNDLSLTVKIIDNPRALLQGKSPLAKIDYRLSIYDELTASITANKIDLVVKNETPFGPSKNFKKRVNKMSGSKIKIKTYRNFEDDILQFTGFLTGNVVADHRNVVKCKVKTELLSYLKYKLNISSIEKNQNYNNKIITI